MNTDVMDDISDKQGHQNGIEFHCENRPATAPSFPDIDRPFTFTSSTLTLMDPMSVPIKPNAEDENTSLAVDATTVNSAFIANWDERKEPFVTEDNPTGGHPSPANHLKGIPLELWLRIFEYLPVQAAARFSRVCQSWCLIGKSVRWRIDDHIILRDLDKREILRLLSAAGHCLRVINLRGCHQVSTRMLCHIANRCRNIEVANLSCCSLTPRGLVHFLSRSWYLRKLDVSGLNCVNGKVMDALAVNNWGHLVDVNFSKCCSLEAQDFCRVLETRQNLVSLNLSDCLSIDASVFCLINRQSQLRHLSLNSTRMGLVDLQTIFFSELSPPPRLIALDIGNNSDIDDNAIEYVMNHCPGLQELNIGGCQWITNRSLDILSNCASKIRHISVAQCVLVTDAGILPFVGRCQELASLRMKSCGLITIKTLQYVQRILSTRSVDVVPWCDGFDQDDALEMEIERRVESARMLEELEERRRGKKKGSCTIL